MNKLHRNQVGEALKRTCVQYHLDHSYFKFTDYPNNDGYLLSHRNSEFFYKVTDNSIAKSNVIDNKFMLEFRPSLNSYLDSYRKDDIDSFELTLYFIETWIQKLSYEVNTPDFWEELAKSQTTNALEATDNEPLTQEEQTKVIQILDSLEARILELENAHQETKEELKAYLDKEIAEIKDASKILGKKWFINQVAGFITTSFLRQAISPENVEPILDFFMQQVRISLLASLNVPALENNINS